MHKMFLFLNILYRTLKRFPVTIIVIYIIPLALSLSAENVIANEAEGHEERIEIIEINNNKKKETNKEKKTTTSKRKGYVTLKTNSKIERPNFSKSAFHKLYILYQKISIDRC